MKTLIIFGAGERGIHCKRELDIYNSLYKDDANEKPEVYFTDNNEALWGSVIEGIEVVPPHDLRNFNKECTEVVIASSRVFELQAQISKMGLTCSYVLDNADKIVPFNSMQSIAGLSAKNDMANEKAMLHQSFFESYKCLGEMKYSAGTLYDDLFFGFERHLVEFKDIHKGKRCFILGNGSSLNKVDISLLKDEVTFGSNRVYLAFPEWGFHTKYWCMQDDLCILQTAYEALQSLPDEVIKFFPAFRMYNLDYAGYKNVVPYNHLTAMPDKKIRFSTSPFGTYEGFTVTHTLIQMAAIMGCNPIYLIGVDHNYPVQPQNGQKRGYDPESANHFHPRYSGGNLLMNQHYVEETTKAYQLAYESLKQIGVELYNASEGTKLDVIPKIRFDHAIK